MSRLLTAGILQQAANLKKQYALSFDGVNDYVDLGSAINFSNPPWTVEVSFSAPINDLITNFIYNFWGSGQDFIAPAGYSSIRNGKTFNSNGGSIFGTIALGHNIKHTMSLRYNGNNEQLSVFIDGAIDVQKSPSGFVGSPNCIIRDIGRFNEAQKRYFNGNMLDFRVWNGSRTQQEIQENLNTKLTGNEPGLVACYDFNQYAGNILYDKTPNANHGQIIGATWVEL